MTNYMLRLRQASNNMIANSYLPAFTRQLVAALNDEIKRQHTHQCCRRMYIRGHSLQVPIKLTTELNTIACVSTVSDCNWQSNSSVSAQNRTFFPALSTASKAKQTGQNLPNLIKQPERNLPIQLHPCHTRRALRLTS